MEKKKLMKDRRLSKHSGILATLVACTWLLAYPLQAQQAEPAPAPATPQTQTKSPSDPAAPTGKPAPASPATPQTQTAAKPANDATSTKAKPAPTSQPPKDDRIFFALPNLLTVENASSMPPLTTRQKFKTVAEGCFDPVEVAFIGIQAGIGQADNTDPTYHQGFIGYSRRFGTDYADAIIGNFGTGAIFPTLLHQDPRYYQMGTGNVFHRIEHAGIRVLITTSDRSGRIEPNFSELFGNGLAAGLSNAYHPGPHTFASSADVLGTQVLLDAIGYELKEFWPDLRRAILRGKK
jgi:hypothetical protein